MVLLFLSFPAFDDVNQLDTVSSLNGLGPSFLSHSNPDVSVIAGGSAVASEHDNDSTEEISELGTICQGRENSADPAMENSTSKPNLSESLDMTMKYGTLKKNFLTENPEGFSRHKILAGRERYIIKRDKQTDITMKISPLIGDGTDQLPEIEYGRRGGHFRRLSTESVESDLSSTQASESDSGVANLFGDGSPDRPENYIQFQGDLLVLLSDERHKLKRVLNTTRRRVATAKTDMEDLIARLNQEVAVKQFLTTKVNLFL